MRIVPKNMDKPVHIIHPDFDEFSSFALHDIIRVILPCGLRYAVDPTGLQMGWSDSLIPWDSYARRRIHRLDSITEAMPRPPGYTIIASQRTGSDAPAVKNSVRGSLMETVAQGVNKQIDLAGWHASVKRLLGLSEPNFSTCRDAVIAALKRGLDSCADDIRAGAQPFCPVPRDIDTLPESQIHEACLCLDMLWRTNADLVAANGDRGLLHNIVKRRWERVVRLGRLPGI